MRRASDAREAEPARAPPPAEPPIPPDTDEDEEQDALPEQDRDAGQANPLPEDPVERGPCSLLLRFFDASNGSPIEAMTVALYRLGAPGNAHWTEGDQLQARFTSGGGGARLDALPEGRYRIFALGQRAGSDDPPAFQVSGERTALDFELRMPRTEEVLVRILDETGRPLGSAQERRRTHAVRSGEEPVPSWREARLLRSGAEIWRGRRGGRGGSRRGRQTLTASEDGTFLLGTHTESDRQENSQETHWIELAGRNDVVVRVTDDPNRTDAPQAGDAPTQHRFFALALPRAWLEGLILLPDGRRVEAAGGKLTLECEAVRGIPGEWRTLPIRVAASVEGYEDLELAIRLGALPAPAVMRPR